MSNYTDKEHKEVITDLLAVAEQTQIDLKQKGLADGLFAKQVDTTIDNTRKHLAGLEPDPVATIMAYAASGLFLVLIFVVYMYLTR